MEFVGKIINALTPRLINTQRGEVIIQSFVIEEVKDQYAHRMVFEVFGQDKLDRFAIQVGQVCKVSFDIDAREWNGKWYNSIRAFDVRPENAAQSAPSNAGGQSQATPTLEAAAAKLETIAEPIQESTDDVPF